MAQSIVVCNSNDNIQPLRIICVGEWRGMEVAIKLLKYQSGTGVYDDFKREVENMEAFRSPYIVNFIGAVHLSGSLSIVTVRTLFLRFSLNSKGIPATGELSVLHEKATVLTNTQIEMHY